MMAVMRHHRAADRRATARSAIVREIGTLPRGPIAYIRY